MHVTLILGGARSGKSQRALTLGKQPAEHRVFIATAEARDAEMRQRVAAHQRERREHVASHWSTVEEPVNIVPCIQAHASPGTITIVDCLTLWLSNLMARDNDVNAATRELAGCAAQTLPGRLLLVSNEVGMGLVPETPLGREFRDAQGRLNAAIAMTATDVEFLVAGLPMKLKQNHADPGPP